MKKSIIVLFLITILNADNFVPVMVGGYQEEDACSTLSEVRGLDPRGDGFLTVRRGPSSKYQMIERLHNGDRVISCDNHGKWIGIVYGRDDCGVSTPITKRSPYRGSCKSGWVYGKWIVDIAG
jgi:hypothetical protein